MFELSQSGDMGGLSIPSDMTRDELLLLYRLATGLDAGAVVEIGSYLGASSCLLAAGCRRSCSRVICVDTWLNDAMSEGSRDTFGEFLANTQRYSDIITAVRSPSVVAAQTFSGRIQLLFIDGDHSRQAVYADLHAWLPHVDEEAWVVMHDSGWAEGVQSAISELIEPIRVSTPRLLPNMYGARICRPS